MNTKNPYLPINDDWLQLCREEPIDKGQIIIDPHHHLWDLDFGKYLHKDFLLDIKSSGHNVVASVYIMSSANTQIYDKFSHKEYETIPEIIFAFNEYKNAKNNKISHCQMNESIVGSLDLRYGKKLIPVIERGLELSNGKLKGIRMLLAAHPDKSISSGAVKSDLGIMMDPKFLDGAKILQKFNLSLDFWIHHTQLNEMEYIARSIPDLSIILNHIGGPIHLGPYEGKPALTHREWRHSMMRLALCPNISVKLGGLGMAVNGSKFFKHDKPPSSEQLCESWKPWIYETLDLFGFDRCMFESNFPVDKGSCSYGNLWNAFKKITKSMSVDEKNKLFYKNAEKIYKIYLN